MYRFVSRILDPHIARNPDERHCPMRVLLARNGRRAFGVDHVPLWALSRRAGTKQARLLPAAAAAEQVHPLWPGALRTGSAHMRSNTHTHARTHARARAHTHTHTHNFAHKQFFRAHTSLGIPATPTSKTCFGLLPKFPPSPNSALPPSYPVRATLTNRVWRTDRQTEVLKQMKENRCGSNDISDVQEGIQGEVVARLAAVHLTRPDPAGPPSRLAPFPTGT